ncbi:uncharacterized protein [Watersipora subatra]|uniref:uncharacterized protein n=1 Tax=Watersipora subatra TaxID=2589382 RepID=UPI00355AF068
MKHNRVIVTFLIILTVTKGINGGIRCYVCDTTKADNYDPQICDDPFLESRGAVIEQDCAACTKERTYTSGVMFIRRSCEKTLRWESSVYSCSRSQQEREYVFGLPGTRCTCLKDLCNLSPRVSVSLIPIVLIAAAAKLVQHGFC